MAAEIHPWNINFAKKKKKKKKRVASSSLHQRDTISRRIIAATFEMYPAYKKKKKELEYTLSESLIAFQRPLAVPIIIRLYTRVPRARICNAWVYHYVVTVGKAAEG